MIGEKTLVAVPAEFEGTQQARCEVKRDLAQRTPKSPPSQIGEVKRNSCCIDTNVRLSSKSTNTADLLT